MDGNWIGAKGSETATGNLRRGDGDGQTDYRLKTEWKEQQEEEGGGSMSGPLYGLLQGQTCSVCELPSYTQINIDWWNTLGRWTWWCWPQTHTCAVHTHTNNNSVVLTSGPLWAGRLQTHRLQLGFDLRVLSALNGWTDSWVMEAVWFSQDNKVKGKKPTVVVLAGYFIL